MAKCKYKESCGYEFCLDDCCPEFEAAAETNADRIRAMSDEELGEFLCYSSDCFLGRCVAYELCTIGGGKANGLKKWLQQPANEQ